MAKFDPKKLCRACKSEVDQNATKCPHCQTDLRIWPARHPILTFLLVIFLLPTIIGAGASSNKSVDSKTSSTTIVTPVPNPQEDLKMNIHFSGTQFVITNQEEIKLYNCRFEVNGKYEYKADGYLEPNQVYTVGALQFANSKGERFNPFDLKPKSFSAVCYNAQNNSLYNYWEWN